MSTTLRLDPEGLDGILCLPAEATRLPSNPRSPGPRARPQLGPGIRQHLPHQSDLTLQGHPPFNLNAPHSDPTLSGQRSFNPTLLGRRPAPPISEGPQIVDPDGLDGILMPTTPLALQTNIRLGERRQSPPLTNQKSVVDLDGLDGVLIPPSDSTAFAAQPHFSISRHHPEAIDPTFTGRTLVAPIPPRFTNPPNANHTIRTPAWSPPQQHPPASMTPIPGSFTISSRPQPASMTPTPGSFTISSRPQPASMTPTPGSFTISSRPHEPQQKSLITLESIPTVAPDQPPTNPPPLPTHDAHAPPPEDETPSAIQPLALSDSEQPAPAFIMNEAPRKWRSLAILLAALLLFGVFGLGLWLGQRDNTPTIPSTSASSTTTNAGQENTSLPGSTEVKKPSSQSQDATLKHLEDGDSPLEDNTTAAIPCVVEKTAALKNPQTPPLELNNPSTTNNTEPTAEPVVAEPVVAEPVVAEPVIAEPVIAEPVIAKPVVEEPVVEEPAIEEPRPTTATYSKRPVPVHFPVGQIVGKVTSPKKIQAIAAGLKACRGKIVVTGHTSSLGRPGKNIKIGRRRARAVRELLVALGVPRKRIKIHSMGGEQPLAPDDTERGRSRNRRVTVLCR